MSDEDSVIRQLGSTLDHFVYDSPTGLYRRTTSENDVGDLSLSGDLVVASKDTGGTCAASLTAGTTPQIQFDLWLPPGALAPGMVVEINDAASEAVEVGSVSSRMGGTVTAQSTTTLSAIITGASSTASAATYTTQVSPTITSATLAGGKLTVNWATPLGAVPAYPNPIGAGATVTIAGATPAGVNGTYSLTHATNTSATFVYGGSAWTSGGTITLPGSFFQVGEQVTITGLTPAAWNTSAPVIAVSNTGFSITYPSNSIAGAVTAGFGTATATASVSTLTLDTLGVGSWAIRPGQNYLIGEPPTFIAGNVFKAGDRVTITSATPSGYNGTWTVQSATPTTFTLSMPAVHPALAAPSAGFATGPDTNNPATITGGTAAFQETAYVDPNWIGIQPVRLTHALVNTHVGDLLYDPLGHVTGFMPTEPLENDHPGPVAFSWDSSINWRLGVTYIEPRYKDDPEGGYVLQLGHLTIHPNGQIRVLGTPIADSTGLLAGALSGGSSGGGGGGTIVASQIASVNPSTLTGTGTVPLAGLAGITTSQLAAAAGIVATQIASIPAHASTHIGASASDPTYPDYGKRPNNRIAPVPIHFFVGGTVALTQGTSIFVFFIANKTLAAAKILYAVNVASSGVITLTRGGIWTYNIGTGAMSLVAKTATNTTSFGSTASGSGNMPITLDASNNTITSYSVTAGSAYAIQLLQYLGTGPTLVGRSDATPQLLDVLSSLDDPIRTVMTCPGMTNLNQGVVITNVSQLTAAGTLPWTALST